MDFVYALFFSVTRKRLACKFDLAKALFSPKLTLKHSVRDIMYQCIRSGLDDNHWISCCSITATGINITRLTVLR